MGVLKIKTAYDFAYYDNERMILKSFTKVGLALKHELMGERVLAVENRPERKEQLMCARSFAKDTYTLEELKEAVATFASVVGERLRAQQSLAGVIEVFVMTNRFKNTPQAFDSGSYVFTTPTMDTLKMIKAAHQVLEEIYRPGLAYKKAGVRLVRLRAPEEIQLDFFGQSDVDSPARLALMNTMDQVNAKNGPMTVKSLVTGLTPNATWRTLQEHLSPASLSSWCELPRVRA